MDQISSILTSFPAVRDFGEGDAQVEDAAIHEYISSLKGLGSTLNEAVLANARACLQLVDPSANSIGCLTILEILLNSIDPSPTCATAPAIDRSVVLDATVDFLLRFEPTHVRYVGSSLLAILEKIGAGKLFSHLVAVELLAAAMLRIDPSGSVFTSTHLVLAKLAYETNCIEPALKVIDADVISYPTMSKSKEKRLLCDVKLPPTVYISPSTGLTRDIKSTTVLEYNLVCGLTHTSRRDWSRARKAFERVITHPTKDKGVSKIMTDCYKKWLLVGLLSEGRAPALSSYTASCAKSAYTSLAGPYTNVASLFSTPEASQLKAEVESNNSTWTEDGNGSLMAEVLSAYQKWQIVNMQDVYSQVAVSQIMEATSSAETGLPLGSTSDTTSLIQGMIESGFLKGELCTGVDGADGYLTFHTDRSLLTEQDLARQIAQSHHIITALGKEYQLVNDQLSGNKEYIKYLVREQKRADKELENPSGGFETQIEDEDLMTGIIANG